ncbi:acetyl-CoA synthetase [Intrasporangium chromatireducens Q5-1]|uniref:Acetyl-coenzyme A synthetase n=1 Tax=Intrasporangium chromatireducens Q5-1 TaxID=584657 RepID=W9GHV4_9MICO|nr:acetate--CoA ligase [Intrasporangium chromatireducens]EWT04747.1 acetyl-CoA synthetase [Intrasporangium chromatireducens Q5-1]
MSQETLSNLLHEQRRFPPSEEFAAQAVAKPSLYEEAAADREAFWGRQAHELLTWSKDFDQVLDWTDAPFAKWFVGGRLNACYNCVDRHVEAGLGDRVAYYWQGDPEGDKRTITYADLQRMVCQAANALESLGIHQDDTVAIYLPMIPETVVAMLACARIGAPHTLVFAGFSAEALASRIADADARVVITADGQFRRGTRAPLKPQVDEAVAKSPGVEKVVVVRRTGDEIAWDESRDVWWHDLVDQQSDQHEAHDFDSEQPLYILYTSGTTGKPKGIFHTTGGYLTQCAYTHRNVFDVHPERDVYWCAADVGWVTGHSYIVYGPLTNAATSILYEGVPHPGAQDRWWKLIDERKVSILYTAPTTIRTYMKWGTDMLQGHDLSSLRLLGSVGEPINPEAWIWYRDTIGGGWCPVVDTWWQTETGAIMVSPLPGVTATKPGSAMRALPGITVDVVDDTGQPVPNGSGGYLVVTSPWPAMLRGVWGDPERYRETYWSRFPGLYFAGDGAKKDEDGDLWLLGRVDDVMNVSGHRLSTTEIESALVSHPKVAEAAVVGANDPTTGQMVCAFVILRQEAIQEADEPGEGSELVAELRDHVAKEIGPIAKPREILVVSELPKTRSGKIMRRLLRDVAEDRAIGDVTTLADSTVMDQIRQRMATTHVPGH